MSLSFNGTAVVSSQSWAPSALRTSARSTETSSLSLPPTAATWYSSGIASHRSRQSGIEDEHHGIPPIGWHLPVPAHVGLTQHPDPPIPAAARRMVAVASAVSLRSSSRSRPSAAPPASRQSPVPRRGRSVRGRPRVVTDGAAVGFGRLATFLDVRLLGVESDGVEQRAD